MPSREKSANKTAEALCTVPTEFFEHSHDAMQTIPRSELDRLHLEALQIRYRDLRGRIPLLAVLAESLLLDDIHRLNDVVPTLFEHTIYKSYAPDLLALNDFDEMNRWLSKLSAHDITVVDASGCSDIDDWLDLMDQSTPLMIAHSSGTSGTLSFLPFSGEEYDTFAQLTEIDALQRFGEKRVITPREHRKLFYVVSFRSGGLAGIRLANYMAEYLVASDDRVLGVFPDRLSSEGRYLSVRKRACEDIELPPLTSVQSAKLEEFERTLSEMPERMERFMEETIARLPGERLYMFDLWDRLHAMAKKHLRSGHEAVFSEDSVIGTIGGNKGKNPPTNWAEDVCRFFGVNSLVTGYGMSEILAKHYMCSNNNYHFAPWVVPFVLDPATSQPLPREGAATGRAAFFDLTAETHWGGIISGDEATVNWESPCGCGRSSYFIEGEIQRYSTKYGGVDEIAPAAGMEAHHQAMRFLAP